MATETWVINENPNASTLPNTSINFTSNEMSFSSIHYFSSEDNPATILYGDTHAWSMGVWINEAFRTVIFETAPTGNLLTWLQANATKQESTSKVSVDLTTLPGWSSLSSGSHNITIVAKADGFKDSAPSAAVQVEKSYTIQPGVYKWVDNPVLPGKNDGGGSQPIKFSSNALTFISLSIVYDRVNGYSRIRYRDTASDDWIEVYKTSWANINYKTITVSETFTTTAEAWYYYTFGGSGNLVKQPSK